jgi:hypothetical protein
MKIIKQGVRKWNNLHETVTQSVVDVYDLANETKGNALENYNDTTKGIQGLIRESINTGIPIRPIGGNWSLSPVSATPGIILNTKPLNTIFTITTGSISAHYVGEARRLCFAQCGAGVWELNKFLFERGLSLSACGASNGQTIAGAMATGTHGAAIGFGAIQDAAVGLHLIVGPDKHIYLERASRPVMAESFAAKLGAALVRDDEAFNAAVVGIGAFGFVHGVMLEVEDLYLLEAYLRRVPYDEAFIRQVTTLDFAHPQLPFPGERPFHFQSLINPYDLKNGVYMTTMYKRPYRKDYTPPKANGAGIGPGDDAPCFIGKLAGALPALVPTLVTKVLGSSLKPYEKVTGTLGEIFNNTTLRGKVASAAIGFPAAEAEKVIKILLAVNEDKGPFTGLFAFRFVKKSEALLAFTRFDPTCVLELDGVQSPETTRFYEAMWAALDKAGIAFTFHWGKINSLTPERMQRMYGSNLDRFIAARARIMDTATLTAFSNKAFKDWGIDGRMAAGEVLA